MRTERLLASSLALAVASAAHSQVHVYVDDDAPDGGNGLSWNSAMNDLHRAIDVAHKLGEFRGEIRIAGGTYRPDGGTGDQTRAFTVPPAVLGAHHAFVGGYAGLADPTNPNVRNTELYRSILDADLLGNDNDDNASRSDNADTLMFFEEAADSRGRVLSGITLDGIEFRGAGVGAIRSVNSGVSLSFVGCRFFDNWGSDGSVMQLCRQIVLIDSCEITDNRTSKIPGVQGGGAFAFDSCDVAVRHSTFENNRHFDSPGGGGDARGGAISMYVDRPDGISQLRMSDSEFQSNSAYGNGGAVSLIHTDAEIDSTDFFGNVARYDFVGVQTSGGAVDAFGSDVEIRDCEFQFNTAQVGGAINTDTRLVLRDSDFYSNIAAHGAAFAGVGDIAHSRFDRGFALELGSGGAASLLPGSKVSETVFVNNTAELGGAIVIAESADHTGTIEIADSEFEFNDAYTSGGAIYDPNGSGASNVTVNSCQFRTNSAGGFGGALHGVGEVLDSILEVNQAGLDGGAAYDVGLIDSCSISQNTVTRHGGGVYSADTIRDSEILSNYAFLGGGIFDALLVQNSNVSLNFGINGGGGFLSSSDGDVLVSDSVFRSNNTSGGSVGTAIRKDGAGRLDVVRSTAVNTHADSVAMFWLRVGETWVESSIIHDDTSDSAALVRIAAGAATVFIHSNLRADNSAILYEDADDLYLLGGNISGDPLFVDAASGNVRLSSGSPCIDAGFAFSSVVEGNDIYGQSRQPLDDPGTFNSGQGAGGFLDIGAVEFQGTTCLADVNGDGSLTAADFTAWIAAYNTGNRRADQNLDGFIDQGDFTAWISNYSAGCD